MNLALGFHAGDPLTLARTVKLARQHGLGIGAHPGYPDLLGFGRRALALSPNEIHAATLYQLGALSGFLRAEEARLQHVKAHGALYSRVHEDRAAGEAFCGAVRDFAPGAAVIVLAGPGGQDLAHTATQLGLAVKREAFPERAYTAGGQLASRTLPGSSIHDPAQAARRAVELAHGHAVTLDGTVIDLQADTLCIHGDNPAAIAIAQAIREALRAAGITLAAQDGIDL